jgi:hypothetical protein
LSASISSRGEPCFSQSIDDYVESFTGTARGVRRFSAQRTVPHDKHRERAPGQWRSGSALQLLAAPCAGQSLAELPWEAPNAGALDAWLIDVCLREQRVARS